VDVRGADDAQVNVQKQRQLKKVMVVLLLLRAVC
jgi:hypothetical protein